MKIKGFLNKVVVSTITSIMMLSSVVGAATLKVPSISPGSREYADMRVKAGVFGNLKSLVEYSFTQMCIAEATIDRAITSANTASRDIRNLAFYDGSNNRYTGPYYYHWESNSGTIPYIRDNGYVSRVNQQLRNASIGPIDLVLKTEILDEARRIRPTSEYYDKLYLLTTHDLYTTGSRLSIVDFQTSSGSDIKTLNQISKYLSDYATFLTSLKNFYKAAGCYSPTKPDKPIKPPKPVIPVKDAVITVRDRTIKLNTKFVIMQGVKAMDNGGRGPNITNKVTISGKINTAKVGKYRMTYSVRGANGNMVNKVVRYNVVR